MRNINTEFEYGKIHLAVGAAGSGKTTLLKIISGCALPGKLSGEIIFDKGHENRISLLSNYVITQNEAEFSVYEYLEKCCYRHGAKQEDVPLIVADAAAYFGCDTLADKRCGDLSGGQKKIVSLCAALLFSPDILVADEPVIGLDSIASARILRILKELKDRNGLTVIMSSPTAVLLLPVTDNIYIMSEGEITSSGEVKKILSKTENLAFSPYYFSLFASLLPPEELPVTVSEARRLYEKLIGSKSSQKEVQKEEKPAFKLFPVKKPKPSAELKHIFFKYGAKEPLVLSDLSIEAYPGEALFIAGNNGSGKTTTLKLIAKQLLPFKGKAILRTDSKCVKKVFYLPQDITHLLETASKTVGDALSEINCEKRFYDYPAIRRIKDRKISGLSAGERKFFSVIYAFAVNADILLLDEPENSLDIDGAKELIRLIDEYKKAGRTVIAASHDAQLATLCFDRCYILFNGQKALSSSVKEFFSDSFHAQNILKDNTQTDNSITY